MFTLSLPRTLAGALLLSGAANAQAATLLVTVKADAYDGVCSLHCSLRDAVAVANQSGMANTILLPSGTYILTRLDPLDSAGIPIEEDGNLTGDLDVVGELLIKGAGLGKSIIKGPSDTYDAINHRLVEVHPDARVRLDRLTLKHGRSAYNGGAVENHGRLSLRQVGADNNISTVHGMPGEDNDLLGGGAIANYGQLLIRDSLFEENLTKSTGLSATAMGGALFNDGNLTVHDSHFDGNGSDDVEGRGHAIYNRNQATIERSSFTDNFGWDIADGAVANEGGVLTLTNSTLTRNDVAVSNGLYDKLPERRSTATLTNVTIAGNGYFLNSAVINGGELVIRNSVIAGNTSGFAEAGDNCNNRGSNFSYQATGLLMNDEESNCTADLFVPFEQTFTTVLSAAPTLQSNGTQTLNLLPGSPAIDAGIGNCIAKDQRGVSRPKDGNGDGVAVCDLGAYELIP